MDYSAVSTALPTEQIADETRRCTQAIRDSIGNRLLCLEPVHKCHFDPVDEDCMPPTSSILVGGRFVTTGY
jgi:hypothetical protein